MRCSKDGLTSSGAAERITIFGHNKLDEVKVIKDGHVIQAGKYDELLQACTDFDALVSAHHEAIEAMDTPNHFWNDCSTPCLEFWDCLFTAISCPFCSFPWGYCNQKHHGA